MVTISSVPLSVDEARITPSAMVSPSNWSHQKTRSVLSGPAMIAGLEAAPL